MVVGQANPTLAKLAVERGGWVGGKRGWEGATMLLVVVIASGRGCGVVRLFLLLVELWL